MMVWSSSEQASVPDLARSLHTLIRQSWEQLANNSSPPEWIRERTGNWKSTPSLNLEKLPLHRLLFCGACVGCRVLRWNAGVLPRIQHKCMFNTEAQDFRFVMSNTASVSLFRSVFSNQGVGEHCLWLWCSQWRQQECRAKYTLTGGKQSTCHHPWLSPSLTLCFRFHSMATGPVLTLPRPTDTTKIPLLTPPECKAFNSLPITD